MILFAMSVFSVSWAQDSCVDMLSCSDLGYTKTQADCKGKKYITCPFDTTAYYCPEVVENCDFSEYPLTECPNGGNCSDYECKGTTQFKLDSCQSGYEIAENSCSMITSGAIKISYSVGSKIGTTLSFYIEGNSGSIDWGDGTSDTISSSSTSYSHTYTAKSNTTVVLVVEGNVRTFYMTSTSLNGKIVSFDQLDLNTLQSVAQTNDMSFAGNCSSVTELPDTLPPNLIDGTRMFYNCTSVTSDYPELPSTLVYGSYMFYYLRQAKGTIPVLPESLEIADYMFVGNIYMKGPLDALPEGLKDATSMFASCKGLSGSPVKPSGLVEYNSMFDSTGVTNDGSWDELAFE